MKKTGQYSPEVRERAVRLVLDHERRREAPTGAGERQLVPGVLATHSYSARAKGAVTLILSRSILDRS